jgi:subtilase family serine protease
MYAVDKLPSVLANIATIPAGSTTEYTFPLYLKAGPHSVNATIDSTNIINELDETNNNKVLSFNSIVPDLIINTITMSPVTAIPGDNVTITVKVENRGREKALNSRLALSIDGSIVGSADIKVINMSAIVSQDFSWKAVAGQHEIIAYADIDNTVLESDETNNSKSRTINIENPAAPIPQAVKTSTASIADKGFIVSWWWLLLIVAAFLGGAAFVVMLKSFKKD